MKRIPEPELMDSFEQVKAYAAADFSLSDDSFITKIATTVKSTGKSLADNDLILDLGCGPGNISERLASRWQSSKVLGIDGSSEMLSIARNRLESSNRKGRLRNLSYMLGEIAQIASGDLGITDKVELVVSNSLLHHIHDPLMFWKALKFLGNKDTLTVHRDLRRPSSPEEVSYLQKKYLPNAPEILIRDYLASLYAAFSIKEVELQIQFAGLNKLEVYEVDDRYLEIIGTI